MNKRKNVHTGMCMYTELLYSANGIQFTNNEEN